MKQTLFSFAAAVFLAGFAALPASAGVVYDNSCGGTGCSNAFDLSGWTTNFGFWVSDSFTLGSEANLSAVDFWAWTGSGDRATQVDWSIGTSPDASDIASGTAGLNSNFIFTNSNDYDVYQYSFGIPSQDLQAGTYYLTLQNAVTNEGGPLYWDQSDGPSTAFESQDGALADCGFRGETCSESFDIGTPEPGTITLLGAGLLAIGGFFRRKIAR